MTTFVDSNQFSDRSLFFFTPLFSINKVHITKGIGSDFEIPELNELLTRHASGDWGTAGKYEEIVEAIDFLEDGNDGKENVLSLMAGEGTINGYYHLKEKDVWVITEFLEDKQVQTTILLKEEY